MYSIVSGQRGREEDVRAVTDAEVPAELARLWRLSSGSRLGRPAALDVDRVVQTAVQLADRAGLAGVTLPKIAAELDVTSMSLYRYVGSKDELFVLMQDAATGPPPQLDVPAEDWRAGLRAWAVAQRLALHERPWVARLPVTGPPAGPNQIGWMDVALRVLRGTGLDWGAKLGVLTLVSGYVRQASLLADELAAGRRGSGMDQAAAERAYGRALAQLVDPQRFPEVAAMFASAPFETPPPEGYDDPATNPDFTFGLDRILDGVAAAIEQTPPT